MTRVSDLVAAMEQIAPLALAQKWDNVGLLAGDPGARCERILLTIDLTRAVVREAVAAKCGAIVSYHPPIFQAVKSLRLDDENEPLAAVALAMQRGIAIHSPHTALDAAPSGTGDAIISLCGAETIGPLGPGAAGAAQVKLVTFLPSASVEAVAGAMAGAGAGRIGDYTHCSFRSEGTGTFLGGEATNPVVGRRGRLEHAPEVRLEMVCPAARVAAVIAALRSKHPYEEPAFDLVPLMSPPSGAGIGRMATLPRAMPLRELARLLARKTKSRYTTIIGNPSARVRKLAVLVGSAGRVQQDFPASRDAEVVITGEIRHHDAIYFRGIGANAIALGHWNSERPVLPLLAAELRRRMNLMRDAVRISRADADPFSAI